MKNSKTPTAYYKDCCSVFFTFYKEHFDLPYAFSGCDGVHLKAILRRLEQLYIGKGQQWNKAAAVGIWKLFLEEAHRDKWLQTHFTLPVLSSQYNAILLRIRERVTKSQKYAQNWQAAIQQALRIMVREYSVSNRDEGVIWEQVSARSAYRGLLWQQARTCYLSSCSKETISQQKDICQIFLTDSCWPDKIQLQQYFITALLSLPK